VGYATLSAKDGHSRPPRALSLLSINAAGDIGQKSKFLIQLPTDFLDLTSVQALEGPLEVSYTLHPNWRLSRPRRRRP
jgi:hypothetical protein